jgi:hypothetical protein
MVLRENLNISESTAPEFLFKIEQNLCYRVNRTPNTKRFKSK